MQLALGIGIAVFFALMVGISLLASKRIHTGEDYIVAGRHLGPVMTTATIMATWYAAETILVTADWVRTDGIHVMVLEPIGIGICLMLAGWLFAKRLWDTKLMTLADVFGQRFGPVAEKLQAFASISYIGWVSVQLIGLAGVFNVFFDMPMSTGILLITFVLTLYTLLGGMWSVAMTDIVQLGLLLIGIVVLTLRVLAEFGDTAFSGLAALFDQLDAELLVFVPTDSWESVRYWIGLIVIGVFANAATQDLAQRMLSARSGKVAEASAIAAGLLYIIFGMMPVLLGLSGSLLLDDSQTVGVIPALAEMLFTPTLSVIFALTLTAAVTSSVDSGLLAAAAVIARNVAGPILKERISLIALTRISVVLIAILSATLAMSGTRASELIQVSYSLTLPSFVVLFAALYHKNAHYLPGVLTIGTGIALWLYEIVGTIIAGESGGGALSPGFPYILFGLCIAVYVGTDQVIRLIERSR
jgi:SSS family solute:Na+ symporter